MILTSASFADGERIPEEYAFCAPDPQTHVRLSANRNPALEWSDLPMGTRSLVLICHDYDVPAKADDVNQEDRTIPEDLARMDFFHWVLVDLDPQSEPIRAGEFSDGVTPRGKPGPQAPRGTRQGVNDYTMWFANDDAMRGDYYGYDGPCPPWNDSIVHHYVFTLYALDVSQLTLLHLPFRGLDVLNAMKGHVLEEAKLTGVYSLNPEVFD
jgi:Raf kinase inhibitor-like YbhB/YbcL family protein